uniref:Uncharacterized protein n=1 Tax=Sphaerodactylus townsendi TaxID=933632 RepID=A0ACB8F115_9SAUR
MRAEHTDWSWPDIVGTARISRIQTQLEVSWSVWLKTTRLGWPGGLQANEPVLFIKEDDITSPASGAQFLIPAFFPQGQACSLKALQTAKGDLNEGPAIQ